MSYLSRLPGTPTVSWGPRGHLAGVSRTRSLAKGLRWHPPAAWSRRDLVECQAAGCYALCTGREGRRECAGPGAKAQSSPTHGVPASSWESRGRRARAPGPSPPRRERAQQSGQQRIFFTGTSLRELPSCVMGRGTRLVRTSMSQDHSLVKPVMWGW